MTYTIDAVDLIKEFEGLELTAYQDPVGVWTIGYGLTSAAGIGVEVREGMVITEDDADIYLRAVLDRFAAQIRPLFTVEPTPDQFGAMLSLAYNIGPGAFARSTCLRRFNEGDLEGAAEALTWFNKAGGKVLRGLVRRREAERALFLSNGPPREELRAKPDALRESPVLSTTLQACGVGASGTVGTAVAVVPQLSGAAQVAAIIALALIALAIAWIARERLRKFFAGDR